MPDPKIYRITDEISFRQCDLAKEESTHFGNCTNFSDMERNWTTYYYCKQKGIHFHCTKHPEIEMRLVDHDVYGDAFYCPKCQNVINIDSLANLQSECFRMLNIPEFMNAKLIRLDDWYYPEVKQKEKLESGYWINTHVKTDKDGDTIVVIYIGHKESSEKSQIFIKPEKLQLSNDYKDMDPAKVLSKIELTLRDRKIVQEYDN